MAQHRAGEFSYVTAYEELEMSLLLPSPFQPREQIGDIDELVESIKTSGLIEPIVVRPKAKHFEIIAGNRRYHACRRLNFRRIPAIVVEMHDKEAYEAALAENLQRKTLDPIEEAESFRRYCEDYGWGSQSELARRLGKSQAYVAHRLRLLSLPESVRSVIRDGGLSASTAEEISRLKDSERQREILESAIRHKITRADIREAAVSQGPGRNETSAPDWLQTTQRSRKDLDALVIDRAILSLKVSMVRIDSLHERARSGTLKKVLLGKRIVLHQLIDELLSYKRTRIA
ncbi:MAG: ParB/RepB/Spo0J family partition protein [Nitrososphaerota archaeon]|jgi:ParB family chromosome partitioning protein|nr:ParB/RepB/Spo0J family partition protein [Nitrososphaerota archaeon]MDG6919785.1 ParB/RepB/Spo0J family partition protein [Nitrososphaerota archaeon]MDG6969444.1 ParB/RepB/Spo0J family partition protein [Nitrososphaerota archaeon]MDG6973047.1 ParB/RepB/Spo0J family partition protein [Nitrososphaerota archaeon]MDG6976953.1 ParB/RepB/Spo0J family partition protein [Nitrososphaerota archaeon]